MFCCKNIGAAILVAFFLVYVMILVCRFSIVAIQMHGKHQRTVQFCHSAPERKLSKRIKSLDLNIKSINFKISWYFFIEKYKQIY